jgi:ABC-type uncharacterized transport system substrate-binding protein
MNENEKFMLELEKAFKEIKEEELLGCLLGKLIYKTGALRAGASKETVSIELEEPLKHDTLEKVTQKCNEALAGIGASVTFHADNANLYLVASLSPLG